MEEQDKKEKYKKVDSVLSVINTGLIAVLIAGFIVVGLFIPLLHSYPTKTQQVSYTTTTTQDGNLELGDSKLTQEGKDGEVVITNKLTYSLFDYLFRRDSISGNEVSSEITEEPVNEIVANGTKKYQYMWCTNGTYTSYTDAQFKDPNTGFTHKSEDYCAKYGDGKMAQLADSPPVAQSLSGSSNSSNSITSNTLGPLIQLGSPSTPTPSIQYQPVPYNPPPLIQSTPIPMRKITVTPARPTPTPCTYSIVCQ